MLLTVYASRVDEDEAIANARIVAALDGAARYGTESGRVSDQEADSDPAAQSRTSGAIRPATAGSSRRWRARLVADGGGLENR